MLPVDLVPCVVVPRSLSKGYGASVRFRPEKTTGMKRKSHPAASSCILRSAVFWHSARPDVGSCGSTALGRFFTRLQGPWRQVRLGIYNIHTYTCTHIHIHTYIHKYIYKYINIYTCIHIYLYAYARIYIYHTCIYTYIHLRNINVYTYTYVHLCIYMNAYTDMYIYTHT